MITFPLDSLIIGKNEEYGYPIVDRPYTAEQLREVYKTFFSNGVFMNEQDAFQVTPGDGMNVIVAPGKCLIEGAVGYEKAQRQLAVQAASTTADRIDTVVLRLNLNVEVRNIDLYVKTGTAQDVPVRPTLTRSESVWELGLGDLFIAKNTGAISSARITDTRLQTDRCGAVTPFATIDTTTFFNQIQAAIDENVATLQEQTQVAVELAQSAIDGTTAGNLQNQINANKAAIEANSALDDERWESLSHDTGFIEETQNGIKFRVRKVGKVCNFQCVSASGATVSATPSGTDVIKLPEGFYPPEGTRVSSDATGGTAFMSAVIYGTGWLHVTSSDTRKYWAAYGTYIV